MIERYSFGSMIIQGEQYTSDLKIINGQVCPDWRRKSGHDVDLDEVADMLMAKPDCLIFGSGSFGRMKLNKQLQQHLADSGIEVIVQPSGTAMETFNRMYAAGKNVAAGFHLTC